MKLKAKRKEYLDLREEIKTLLDKTNSAPLLVRLAWHDSGTYDKSIRIEEWPKCGGANGSIRFVPEINHKANSGLVHGLELLKPLKDKHPSISWADLIQMASATAIEQAGGPKIDMRYGRKDVSSAAECAPEGNLPAGAKPWPNNAASAAEHLRAVFERMGFNDQEIVALSGAHTLGRANPERSGLGKDSTKYTDGTSIVRPDGKPGSGRIGGQSWTKQWLKFDNSYFQDVTGDDDDLLKLDTDRALFADERLKVHANEYRESATDFFRDYAMAHKKLSELGSKFEPAGGIDIDQVDWCLECPIQ
ncbi:heme peroxidase [Tribonema minus]|uniref:Heme peroxidase n=1 Tax=Tribonema minus TaxID=303371 RepID=A0A835YUS3_9STRA|nr:heme peroxidase [Tribonema minus]